MAETRREFRTFPKRWGAEFVREGEVRFRLWAPQAECMVLRLAGKDTEMGRADGGWFELLAEGVEPGQTYQFVVGEGLAVPDPASRAQARDVHGPSLVVDPTSYSWRNTAWHGRPWREAVIYELHVGAFTAQGTFAAAAERLDHLARLGVTAVEIMPVGQFAGSRGWGYDGVLPYAPHTAYGTPEDMKRFIDEAHGLGLMVLLDVVYNHFGPDGNYLNVYARDFFDADRHTPWGAGIAYERRPVRDFFIDNALYWLDEFNLDGLRLDAIDQIRDTSEPDLLTELGQRVRDEFPCRRRHLTTEDNRNLTPLHAPRADGSSADYAGEWNDDFHNAAHVLLTGETEGYYEDFARDASGLLARCLSDGFAYQGEPSIHSGHAPRGQPSRHLPTTAFIDFLQNHDQVGNRAHGERLAALAPERALDAMQAVLLLSPHIPLLFMGEEWGETRPFRFFTDFTGELAEAVREGRRREFAGFSAFTAERAREAIPDPNAAATFETSRIEWALLDRERNRQHCETTARLLALRREHIMPLLDDRVPSPGKVLACRDGALAVDWQFASAVLQLRANLSEQQRTLPAAAGQVIHDSDRGGGSLSSGSNTFAPWRVAVAVTS